MSLQEIHLRKLLKILYLDDRARVSALRADIRADLARERGDSSGGGDFYGPFWSDAKDHVFGRSDLTETTRGRIDSNLGRERLYKQLRDGFLLWWNERRRWTNEPFYPADALKTVCRLPGIDANVKFANLLSVRDGSDEDHFVYPYWFPTPTLSPDVGRLALWALSHAFPQVEASKFRVLDVIRGVTYSLDRTPLEGDEQRVFARRFAGALRQWTELRAGYS